MPTNYHKIVLTVFLILISSINYSQSFELDEYDSRYGLILGTTNYITKTDALFSKSSPGYSIGVVGTTVLSDKFELLYEINYSANFVKFVGRKEPEAAPEDIKFELDKINLPILINYTFLNIDDTWRFGIETGPSLSFLHNYILKDESKSDYYLEPLYTDPYLLEFDSNNEEISFNVFLATGLTADYLQLRANLRYYYGLTDPYRQAPFYSPVMDIKGKDSYFTFTLAYFWGN
ncbi:MAG: outer membrane beta-barrel protein [Bacteroidota bacterium]